MVRQDICAVISCGSISGNGVSLHVVPAGEEEANGWLHFLAQANAKYKWKPTKKLVVCTKHFRKCCVHQSLSQKRIKAGHYPSIADGISIMHNAKSKCLPQSPAQSQRTTSSRPSFSSIQRAYLTQKLASFRASKIVIGTISKPAATGNEILSNVEPTPACNKDALNPSGVVPLTFFPACLDNSQAVPTKLNGPVTTDYLQSGTVSTQPEPVACKSNISSDTCPSQRILITQTTGLQVNAVGTGSEPKILTHHQPSTSNILPGPVQRQCYKGTARLLYENVTLKKSVIKLERQMHEMKKSMRILLGRTQVLNGSLKDVNAKYNKLRRVVATLPQSPAEIIDISED